MPGIQQPLTLETLILIEREKIRIPALAAEIVAPIRNNARLERDLPEPRIKNMSLDIFDLANALDIAFDDGGIWPQ